MAVSSSLADLTITPHISGSANLSLGVQFDLAASPGVTLPVLPANTTLKIVVPNLADPTALTATIEPEADLSNLIDSLEAIAIAQVVEGIKRVIGFLDDVQSRGIFQQKIPVLNRTMADLLNTREKLDSLSRDLETNPPASVGQLVSRINARPNHAATVRFRAACSRSTWASASRRRITSISARPRRSAQRRHSRRVHRCQRHGAGRSQD